MSVTNMETRSSIVFALTAERMPSGTPIRIISTMPITAMRNVVQKRVSSSGPTGLPFV